MFATEVYSTRRENLKKQILSGICLFLGNQEAAFNYKSNTYPFRQDSNFLYFWGLDIPNYAAVLDIDNDKEIIFADDIDMDDIIWMGTQESVSTLANKVGVANTQKYSELDKYVKNAIQQNRKIHFLPAYRGETKMHLENLLGIKTNIINDYKSVELIEAVVKLRSIKDELEIEEISNMVDVAYYMHTSAMIMAKPNMTEREIAGTMQGIAHSYGNTVSFPIILTINGQTLHNHNYNNKLTAGKLMLADAGVESVLHYASDITRTTPVGGKFDTRQKEIYEIVLKANVEAIKMIRPNILYKDVHLFAAKTIAEGLKELGLMKGNIDEAVQQGAHALFFPHGLGHMLGLDVHDMEGLGENFVGYDKTITRSTQFGLAFLRLAKKLQAGFVITIEPGCYFIPALIDQWQRENKFTEFINYQRVNTYKDFGGIRIEDDILVTENAHRVLGKNIPKTVNEIEELIK